MDPPAEANARSPEGASCSFCGLSLDGDPARCPRCGTLLGDAADDLKREGDRRRREVRGQKAVADLLFLGGLLAGGPLLSFGIEPRTGLFLILAGGLASAGRRYTSWSTPGTLAIGGLLAAVVAAVVIEGEGDGAGREAELAGRTAFVERLGERLVDDGIYVEARGPEGRVVWFYVPAVEGSACGDVPSAEVRAHLADVGVRRVVVAGRDGGEGVCSFTP